jgi:hypothetical protein
MPKRKSSEPAERVHCDEHGDSVATVICRHLREGSGLGYYAVRDDPWAWCEECDHLVESGAGWHRLNKFAKWQVYCYKCYRRTLRQHRRIAWVQLASDKE